MLETFGFQLNTRMFYGVGYSRTLGEFIKEKGLGRILMLADEGCATKSEYFGEIKALIEKNAEIVFIELLRGTEEPDYDYLDAVTDKARGLGKLSAVIGIGGGSCLDIAKAVAVLLNNSGKGIEYRGFDKVKNPGVPMIAIPTTAGTGSEVTINAVFTDKNEMKKLGINGRYMNATFAVLDAEWTISCPTSVAVSSGMDAMTHALESYTCKQANSLTRLFSKEAFRILYENLPAIVDEPENREKRQKLLLGSYLAAAGLFNSGSGIAGAFSYPIGIHFKVPHGIGGAVFLTSVVEYNVSKGYRDYAELLDLVEYHSDYSVAQKNMRFVEIIRALSDKLGVPRYLDEWGITKDNVDDLARLMLPLQAAFDQNPVPFSAEADAPEMLKNHIRP
ncbi:MAG: iron-containing alcohol dehydrogenase [Deltaproteobacteria bacterium]|nr:iron-containing alcohol dehydrogenase [Deltaproteobacteria bacterium]MBW2018612.1 iron-containing alcohol dehydrogenase [Deltaproteobacteria bacterium]MBW2073878.1 iron-containing alcohol dehydrogenase [Deltaproteobacteria bacterium]